MPTVLETFRDRLLELVPIYFPAGRTILKLPTPNVPDRTAALELAARVSGWLLDALAATAEHEPDLSAIAGNARALPIPVDQLTALRWHELATDLAVIAQGFPSFRRLERLAVSARATFASVAPTQVPDGEPEQEWAPVSEDWPDAGIAAADALYAWAKSPDAVALEARAVLAAMPPG